MFLWGHHPQSAHTRYFQLWSSIHNNITLPLSSSQSFTQELATLFQIIKSVFPLPLHQCLSPRNWCFSSYDALLHQGCRQSRANSSRKHEKKLLLLNIRKFWGCSFDGFVCMFCFHLKKQNHKPNKNPNKQTNEPPQIIYLSVCNSSGYHTQRSIFWVNAENSGGPALKRGMGTHVCMCERGAEAERDKMVALQMVEHL